MSDQITKLEYIVETPEELGAGILGSIEEVSIHFKFGEHPDNRADLTEYFRQALREWYDGAKVYTAKEWE